MPAAPKPGAKPRRCPIHPYYAVKRKPTGDCAHCNHLWERKRANMSRKAKQPATMRDLFKEAERLQGRFIQLRDKACVLCGAKKNLQQGHVISRKFKNLFFHPMNVHAQCPKCNMDHQDDQYPYHSWVRKRFGDEAFDTLYGMKSLVSKYTVMQLVNHILYYRFMIFQILHANPDLFKRPDEQYREIADLGKVKTINFVEGYTASHGDECTPKAIVKGFVDFYPTP